MTRRRRKKSRPRGWRGFGGRNAGIAFAAVIGVAIGLVWGSEVPGTARLPLFKTPAPIARGAATGQARSTPERKGRHGEGSPVRAVEGVGSVTDGPSPVGSLPDGTRTGWQGEGGSFRALALVIDDLGPNLAVAEALLNLDIPLTIGLLPGYAHTTAIAERAIEQGREVILHQPMESGQPGVWPGPGAVFTWMSDGEIRDTLAKNIEGIRVPIAGVNNHMGSRFTADDRAMNVFLGELKRRGMYYLDSVTTAATAGLRVADRLGVETASRSVFLDDQDDTESMEVRWRQAVARARTGQPTVLIGHGKWETIRFLRSVDMDVGRFEFRLLSDIVTMRSSTATATRRQNRRPPGNPG